MIRRSVQIFHCGNGWEHERRRSVQVDVVSIDRSLTCAIYAPRCEVEHAPYVYRFDLFLNLTISKKHVNCFAVRGTKARCMMLFAVVVMHCPPPAMQAHYCKGARSASLMRYQAKYPVCPDCDVAVGAVCT